MQHYTQEGGGELWRFEKLWFKTKSFAKLEPTKLLNQSFTQANHKLN